MSGYQDHKICPHCGRNDLDPLAACTCPGANKPRATADHSRRIQDIKSRADGTVIGSDRVWNIYVGDGAMMSFPIPGWLWQMVHVRPEPNRGTKCDDRMLAASVIESYEYLVLECTKAEAWRRIKIMRKAIREARAALQGETK